MSAVPTKSIVDQVRDFVTEQPALAGLLAVGVAVAGYATYKALHPDPVFVPSESSRRVADDPTLSSNLAEVAETLIELGATGVLTAEEGAILTKEFLELVKAKSTVSDDGVPRLSREACGAVFQQIGVKDTAVADRIFHTWDVDRTGSIDMKEFLHALVLVLRGSHHDKLEMCFTIMDMDNDGKISKPEMVRFLRTVDSLNGEKHTIYDLQRQVDAMFASVKTQRIGYLSRQEFNELASQKKFHLGEKLEAFMNNLQKKFSQSMANAAARVPLGRTPSTDDSGQYSDYHSLRLKAREIESTSPVLSASRSPALSPQVTANSLN